MSAENKTRSEYILDVLLSGKPLLLSDITRMVSEVSGKESRIQDISSLMSKLSSSGQSPVGNFIVRTKTPKGYEYSLVPEILSLAPEDIYDLTRKTGKDRFSLERAVEKIPELSKYIEKTEKPAATRKPGIKKRASDKRKTKGKKVGAGPQKAAVRKPKPGAKPGRKPMKPGRKPLPKPPEPVILPVSADDLINGLMEQLRASGGPRIHVYLTVTLQRG